MKRHEDVPAMLVRERPEDGLELVELAQAAGSRAQRSSLVVK